MGVLKRLSWTNTWYQFMKKEIYQLREKISSYKQSLRKYFKKEIDESFEIEFVKKFIFFIELKYKRM